MSGNGTRTVDTVFEGVITNMERRYDKPGSDYTKGSHAPVHGLCIFAQACQANVSIQRPYQLG